MKKILILLLALTMTFGAVACGSSDEDKDLPNEKPGIEEPNDKEDGEVKPEDGTTDEEDKPASGAITPPASKPNSPTATKPTPPTNGGDTGATLSGTLEDNMSKIYAGLKKEQPNTGIIEVTKENAEYYLGSKNIDFKRAIASEPMMSSVAHSVVLIEMNSGADISATMETIKSNVNGYKWICVGVEPENIRVDSIGNIIILAMDEGSKEIINQFKALAK